MEDSQDYTGTAVEDEDVQESPPAPAPPPRHYAPPRQQQGQQHYPPQGYPPQGYGPPLGAPPQQVGHGVPRGFAPHSHRGVRPLDLITRTDEQFLRIKRVKVSNDVDEDTVGTGYCGNVRDVIGFEDELAKKWGGGLYEISGIYEGKQRVESVKIAGTSKQIRPDPEEKEEDDEYDYSAYTQADRSYSRSRRFGRGYSSVYDDPDPYDGYGGGYGQQGYGRHYAQQPPPPYGTGYGQPGYGGGYGQQHGNPYGGGLGYGQPGYGQPGPYALQAQFGPQGMDGYQQVQFGPQGMARYQQVPGQPLNVYQPVQENRERDEEVERMRLEIAEAREEARVAADSAAAEREERRLDAERATSEAREAELKRQMDVMKAENDRKLDLLAAQAEKQAEEARRQAEKQAEEAHRQADLTQRAIDEAARRSEQQQQQFMQQIAAQNQDKGSSSFDKMMEMQMMQLQGQGARAESERLERAARARDEQAIRREEQAGKVEEYRRERERQDTLRSEERKREEQRRSDSEKHYQHLMELGLKGQQTPDQMLGMLKTMVDMQPKQENATEKVMELANAAIAMREVLGGNQEQESKWERIIKTGGEALSGAIGKIQQGRQQAAQQQVPGYPQQQAQQQHAGLPGPTQQQYAQHQAMAQQQFAQRQAMQQQAMAQQAQQVQQGGREPQPEDWGRILKFVVDCYDGDNDPAETATHLQAMVVNGMRLPKAIERLEKVTIPELKFQLSMIVMSPQVAASEYKAKIDHLAAVLETEDGQSWMEDLVAAIYEIGQQIRSVQAEQHVQQQAFAQQQAQAFAQRQAQARAQQRPLTAEEFRARADGVDLDANEDYSSPPEDGSSADFARKARGPVAPPPKSEWDEGAPPPPRAPTPPTPPAPPAPPAPPMPPTPSAPTPPAQPPA